MRSDQEDDSPVGLVLAALGAYLDARERRFRVSGFYVDKATAPVEVEAENEKRLHLKKQLLLWLETAK